MDAQSTQASYDIGKALLQLTVGVSLALLGAILWNFDSRLRILETDRLTKEDVKDAVKAVLHDDETTRRRR